MRTFFLSLVCLALDLIALLSDVLMSKFGWPIFSEWVLLFLGVAAVAIVGFSLPHAYNNRADRPAPRRR